MNYSEVKIDIEKHSAMLLMPYFSANNVVEDESLEFLMGIGDIDGFVVSRDGSNISVSLWFDYGALISDSIWEMFDKNSLIGMCGDDISDQLTREAVLESVKQLYPKVVKEMEKGSTRLIEGWRSK